MMRRLIIASALVLGSVSASAVSASPAADPSPTPPELMAPRKVNGLITQVEGDSLTISPTLNQTTHRLTGKLDPRKTRVVINGRAARPQDLKIALLAKGEMGLDDTWVSVTAERK